MYNSSKAIKAQKLIVYRLTILIYIKIVGVAAFNIEC
jgi:hypothetical protein